MKILKKDIKHGEIFLEIENLDDLWYLSQILDETDLVTTKTIRKIKLTNKDESEGEAFKKIVLITLTVEKVAFHEYADVLRVSGVVSEAVEDIPKGSHHTFNVEPGTKLTIVKKKWLNYQLERLNEASKEKGSDILICAMERESACFAILTRQGYKMLSELSGEVEKKQEADLTTSNFYQEIIKNLQEYTQRYKVKSIILASPAFWKEDLFKLIDNRDLRSRITLATCNAVGKTAIPEILKRPEIKNVLKDERNRREMELVDSLLDEIAKGNLASYGWESTKTAVEVGAAANLLVTTSLISQKKQENSFGDLNKLMQLAESTRSEVTIINSGNEAGKKLDGLSGIAALLRYKLTQ